MRLGCTGTLAVFLTGLTIAYGLFVRTLKWEPQASFDIIGFLWVFSNIPNLVAWGLFFVLAGLSIWSWIITWFDAATSSELVPDVPLSHLPPQEPQ